MRSIALYKHINVGNILRFIICLCYNSVKWIKRREIQLVWWLSISFSGFLLQGKKWCDLSGWKIDVTSIIRTRIKSEEIKLSCQKFFYSYDISKTKKFSSCFIYPWGFFSFNTLSILARTPIQPVLTEGSSTLRLV